MTRFSLILPTEFEKMHCGREYKSLETEKQLFGWQIPARCYDGAESDECGAKFRITCRTARYGPDCRPAALARKAQARRRRRSALHGSHFSHCDKPTGHFLDSFVERSIVRCKNCGTEFETTSRKAQSLPADFGSEAGWALIWRQETATTEDDMSTPRIQRQRWEDGV